MTINCAKALHKISCIPVLKIKSSICRYIPKYISLYYLYVR